MWRFYFYIIEPRKFDWKIKLNGFNLVKIKLVQAEKWIAIS